MTTCTKNWARPIEPDTAIVPLESIEEIPIVRRLFANVFSRSIRQGLIVLFDQGFYSIATFLTGVLVARASGVNQGAYGLYVLGFTLLLTLQFIQRCLVSVPFTVYSPHLNDRDHATYLGSMLIHILVISGLASLAFAIAAAVVSNADLTDGDGFAGVLLSLAVACVFVLLRDFTRYFLLAQLRVSASLLMGLASNVTTVCLVFWAYKGGWLTAPLAYLILGGCSGLPAIIMLLSRCKLMRVEKNRLFRDLRKNWRFGKWMIATTGVSTLGMQSIPWFVLMWCASSSVAVFGALVAVAGIIRPATMGVAAYLTPRLVHEVKSEGLASAMKADLKVVKTMTIFVVIYITFMWALGEKIVGILYTSNYQGHLMALTIISIGTGLEATNATLKALIRAIGKPEIEFWCSGCASIVCILINISLIPRIGIVGAAIALTGTSLTFAVVACLRIDWMTHNPATS